jgi:hypothetical protein
METWVRVILWLALLLGTVLIAVWIYRKLRHGWDFIANSLRSQSVAIASEPVPQGAARLVSFGGAVLVAAALGASLSWIPWLGAGFAVSFVVSYRAGRGQRPKGGATPAASALAPTLAESDQDGLDSIFEGIVEFGVALVFHAVAAIFRGYVERWHLKALWSYGIPALALVAGIVLTFFDLAGVGSAIVHTALLALVLPLFERVSKFVARIRRKEEPRPAL